MSFPDYGGQGPLLLRVTWAECCLALILYVLRSVAAARAPKGTHLYGPLGFRWDFIWVTVAMICATCAQIFLTVSVLHGTGNHEADLSMDNVIISNLWSWIAQVVAISAATLGRIAVIAFLLLIQVKVNGKLRWLLYVVGTATATINIIEIGLIFRQCQPVDALWNPTVHGNCSFIPITTKVGFLQGSIGAAADFTLALYPILIIGPLQKMMLRMKIGLCVVMAGGVVAGIAAINKTVAIASITKTSDISYETVGLLAWVWTEMWLIIILGSIPPLWSLFKSATSHARVTLPGSRHRTLSFHGSKERAKQTESSIPYDEDGVPLQPFSGTTYSVQSKGASRKEVASNDDGSEDRILPPNDRILVTKDIVVSSDVDLEGQHDEKSTVQSTVYRL